MQVLIAPLHGGKSKAQVKRNDEASIRQKKLVLFKNSKLR
jgi:hypothetical protein